MIKVLDIFSGVGGMSLGLEKAGMKTIAFCEKGKDQRKILKEHWPEVPIFEDITKTTDIIDCVGGEADVIAGGDPCPVRSRARSGGASNHPDLAGYFLSLVGRLQPRWVVRENVPASDDGDFATALGILGYRVVIVRADSASFTGQSRRRDFIIGCFKADWESFSEFIRLYGYGPLCHAKGHGTKQVAPCLTARRARYDTRDCFVWEEPDRFRILDSDEREALAGFPKNWITGVSETARSMMYGNAVVPVIAEFIGQAITTTNEKLKL